MGYKKLLNLSRHFNVTQCINQPTRLTQTSCTVIDHLPIFVIKKKVNIETEKMSFQGSSDEFKEAINIFPMEIVQHLNLYCPMKTFSTKKTRLPYITNDLIQI